MQPVPLTDYLNHKSNWPRRLLGWEPYHVTRSADHVSQEYDAARYAPMLALPSPTMQSCKDAEFAGLGMYPDNPMFVSSQEEVFRTDLRTARTMWESVILSAVRGFATGRVCELGCGYGYNTRLIGGGAYGGEYSANAVTLGRKLGADVSHFNYYQPDYALIEPGSTILTVHSIEQLPSAAAFFQGLASVRANVREVIHLEPCFLPERSSLFGMIRNRYSELIDHNRDLVELARHRPDVEVLHFEPDVFGMHPLNSTHLLVWRFKA